MQAAFSEAAKAACTSCRSFLQRLPQNICHEALLFIAQTKIHRQAHGLRIIAFGIREIALGKTEAFAVIRLRMHRDIVHVHADAVGAQGIENTVAVLRRHQHRIQVQRGTVIGMAERQADGQIRQ